ncbi:MAG TPA: response regulator [Rhizomicrobium sp.]
MDDLQFDFPARRQEFSPTAAVARDEDVTLSAPVFLIVEDDWLLRQAIAEVIGGAGWNVLEAESGETAVALLRSGERIDALITDVRLSGQMSGWDLAETFRASNPKLPVVYVSGNPIIEVRRVAGGQFLPKPCDLQKLINVCELLLLSG